MLNWVLQALCATQTELLRNQVMDLHATARRHPQLLHALKQVGRQGGANTPPLQGVRVFGGGGFCRGRQAVVSTDNPQYASTRHGGPAG